MSAQIETAILAGGCFWGMQDLFRKLPGVLKTRSGYTGGSLPNPTYRHMDTAHDSHAEALEIIFDPLKLSYRRLLEFFFQIHDPTTQDRQGNDIGPHYRSAIFYLSADQEKIAHDVIAAVNASGKWPGTVKTELVKATVFYQAEDYHQDYLEKNPGGYTCHWIRPDWKLADN